jgi:hypothetical protein
VGSSNWTEWRKSCHRYGPKIYGEIPPAEDSKERTEVTLYENSKGDSCLANWSDEELRDGLLTASVYEDREFRDLVIQEVKKREKGRQNER